MGYLKSIGTVIIYIGLFLAVITFLPGLPPHAEYSEYSIKVPHDEKNQLELKGRLEGAEVLFSGEIKGAECFASYNGEIYTGIRGGYVVKLGENRIEPIVKFGQKCDGLWQEEKCGRPLGLKFNDKGELFVADAYYGIFKVNVKTRQYVNIVNRSEPIDGKVPRIFNSLDIAKNGDIYWTDSSTEFGIHDLMYALFSNPSGRFIRYNAATKKNEVLVKNLGFANGVLLSDDESFVIALECFTSRIIKYHLKGPKAGQHEILAEALPGLPDNVHTDGQGGFLITLIVSINPEHPLLLHSLIPHPYIRKMLSRLLYSIEGPFHVLEDIYPNYYAETLTHTVGSFEPLSFFDAKKTSIIIRMDKEGNILDALYSPDKKVYNICSAYIHNGYLWLGSPWNEYIMRVPLKQAFPDLISNKKSSNVKVQNKEEPLVTASETPNVKVEVKSTNTKKASQETATKSRSPPAKEHTTQKPNSDATTAKSTTQKSTTQSSTIISTTTPKPTTASPPPVSKTLTEETKRDTVKKAEKDNLKEINMDHSNSQAKTETLKKADKPTVKSKSNESVKKGARETQPAKSKPVEKKDDSVKK